MVNLWIIYGSGWWFQPNWKIWKSIGRMISNINGKIKNVSNHQIDMDGNGDCIKSPSGARRRVPVLGKSLGYSFGVLAFLRFTSCCLTFLTFCEFGCDLESLIFEPLKWVRVISPWHLMVTFQLTQKHWHFCIDKTKGRVEYTNSGVQQK